MISTKWLDVNKSDDVNPNIRSRMVGRELKLDNRLDLFAATPPLQALRIICSICASHQHRLHGKNFRMMSIDVKRAYVYAKTIRPVYIAIPNEDWEAGDDDEIALLNFSLYGTRDAAQNWTAECTGFRFTPGVARTCSFWRNECELYFQVHGNAFAITGQRGNWFGSKRKSTTSTR